MVTQVTAENLSDLVDAVRSMEKLSIVGSDSGRVFRCGGDEHPRLHVQLSGIVSHDADDQVVTVLAGTPVDELNAEMKASGQCIPFLALPWGVSGTVGGRLCQNLPHGYEAVCGNWRDWVLGLTIVRPDGTVAKAGSKAVKNVAGYDVHRLYVGARGTLGVIAEVILRTYPTRALPEPDVEIHAEEFPEKGVIHRVLRTDFEAASSQPYAASHPQTSTIYRSCESLDDVQRFNHDWVIGWGFGARNLRPFDPVQAQLMRKAQAVFDPTQKLNEGEWPL